MMFPKLSTVAFLLLQSFNLNIQLIEAKHSFSLLPFTTRTRTKTLHRIHQNDYLHIRGGSDGTSDDPSIEIETTVINNDDETPEAAESEPVQVTSTTTTTSAPPLVATPPPPAAATAAKPMNPKLANAIERTGPAVVMLAAIYALLNLTGENGLLYFLIPLMQLGMYKETTGIIEEFKQDVDIKFQKWFWFTTVFASTTLRSYGGFGGIHPATFDLACFCMVALGLVTAVAGMASHSAAGPDMFRKYLGEVSAFHFSLIFLIGQSSFWIKTIKSFGMEWVLFPALLVVVNDTMAYVFGVLMGKHKLLPRLSPKKTVEGFIGAGVSTCAIAIPLLKFFVSKFAEGGKALSVMGSDNSRLVQHAVALGLYASLISPFGGFLASAVKRAHGAKDFGTLIPGHGGVVDRFDCQVVTAPFVYLYLKFCVAN